MVTTAHAPTSPRGRDGVAVGQSRRATARDGDATVELTCRPATTTPNRDTEQLRSQPRPFGVPPPRAFPVRQLSAAGLWLSFSGPYVVRVVLIDGGCRGDFGDEVPADGVTTTTRPSASGSLTLFVVLGVAAAPAGLASGEADHEASRIDGAPARSPGSDLRGIRCNRPAEGSEDVIDRCELW